MALMHLMSELNSSSLLRGHLLPETRIVPVRARARARVCVCVCVCSACIDHSHERGGSLVRLSPLADWDGSGCLSTATSARSFHSTNINFLDLKV